MISPKNKSANYFINKTEKSFLIDGNWNKVPWNRTDPLHIDNDNMWQITYKPYTAVKLCYNDENIYVIFQVKDQYVKCLTDSSNGPVWQDSCVEFFFAPDSSRPENYFNIEINCSGCAYMAYNRTTRIDYDLFTVEDINKTNIAHTIKGLVKKEIEQPIEWIIEYKLPFEVLKKYCKFQHPAKKDTWKANFFKCAENNSHPHWVSWSKVESIRPDFHQSQFMGTLIFN